MQNALAAFWSYVHADDQYERGRIGRLRERLQQSVRFHTGISKFEIFFDRKDIGWGQQWEERIKNSLNDALLLFPVITPSYFASKSCRAECLAFQERQEKLGRDDLILPIYYLTAEILESSHENADADQIEVAQYFRAHQGEDFRSLRMSEETDPSYSQAIERLGQRAAEALKRSRTASGSKDARYSEASKASTSEAEQMSESTSGITQNRGDAAPGHITSFSVNQMPGRADFTRITDAVARAPGGTRLIISAGHYRENVVIDKPLELIGSGPIEDIVIESDSGEPLTFDTNIGLVRNLTIRQTRIEKESEDRDVAVWIKQGRLELEDCDISSTDGACVFVSNDADPRVRRNKIHNGKKSGILISDRARGTYEDNEVFRNALGGFLVSRNAQPTVRRNRSFDNGQSGIYVYDGAEGIYEDNELFDNGVAGLSVESSSPVIRRNRIYGNRRSGVKFQGSGFGTVEDNEIFGNRVVGISIADGARAVVRRNRINKNGHEAVWIRKGGEGSFFDNDLTENAAGAWDLKEADLKNISMERNKES